MRKKCDYSKTHEFWAEIFVFDANINETVYDEQCYAIDVIADKYHGSCDVYDNDHVAVRFMKTDYTFLDVVSFMSDVRKACYKVKDAYFHKNIHECKYEEQDIHVDF